MGEKPVHLKLEDRRRDRQPVTQAIDAYRWRSADVVVHQDRKPDCPSAERDHRLVRDEVDATGLRWRDGKRLLIGSCRRHACRR